MKKLIISIFCLVAAQNTFGHTQDQKIFNNLGKNMTLEAAIEAIEEVDGTSADKKHSPNFRLLFIKKYKDEIRNKTKNLDSTKLQEFKNSLIVSNKLILGELLTSI